MYSLVRSLLFKLDAEKAHHVTLGGLKLMHTLGLYGLVAGEKVRDPVTVMGITFPNRVGLAAGLDKNGEYIDALASLGFGFIEIGTVTPRPQPGNPKPRLFRLPEARAIINRMGFNNKGVDELIKNVKSASFHGVLGINIGKNFDTPIENAVDDYLICLRKVYEYASYIVVNISSPNTKNLRQLQQADEMGGLLQALKAEQASLENQHGRYVPVVVKIAPDLIDEEVDTIANLFLEYKIDGVIATNTTIDKTEVSQLEHGQEQGGLSGAPVKAQSTHVLRRLVEGLKGEIPVIGVGGILCGDDAVEKIEAGADLVQIYSGMIYRGPDLVAESASAITKMTI